MLQDPSDSAQQVIDKSHFKFAEQLIREARHNVGKQEKLQSIWEKRRPTAQSVTIRCWYVRKKIYSCTVDTRLEFY